MAPKGKFGPRRRFQGGRFKERFRRKGPAGRYGGGPRKGSYVGNTFVSLDHVDDSEFEEHFKGSKTGKSRAK